MSSELGDKRGVEIAEISVEAFREFVDKHATSPEIGRIATCLDGGGHPGPKAQLELLGLLGCGRLCGVVCNQLVPSKSDDSRVCKLDSVVIDPSLRKRGLAGLLASEAFRRIVARAGLTVSSIYAHAVHPATVRLLRRLSFSEPPPLGAPISSYQLDANARDRLLAECDDVVRARISRLRLQCALCRAGDRRAQPWCQPRGGSARR